MEIHKRDNYDEAFLKSLINNKVEESIHLDYKSSGSISSGSEKKKELSKDVSAFANSDGGIIIYGIREEEHIPKEFSFIDGTVYTKEWFEQIIDSTIFRSIENIKIYPVRIDGKIKNSVYVVQIPSSLDAPHLCKEKRFYKRHNFQSVQMEEYEIRELYGRKLKSKLSIGSYSLGKLAPEGQDEEGISKYKFTAQVFNEGEVKESDYKLNLYIESESDGISMSWSKLGSSANYKFTKIDDTLSKVSSVGDTIYPMEVLTTLDLFLEVVDSKYSEVLVDTKLLLKLFYSNGSDKIECDLGELFKNIDKQIKALNEGSNTPAKEN